MPSGRFVKIVAKSEIKVTGKVSKAPFLCAALELVFSSYQISICYYELHYLFVFSFSCCQDLYSLKKTGFSERIKMVYKLVRGHLIFPNLMTSKLRWTCQGPFRN